MSDVPESLADSAKPGDVPSQGRRRVFVYGNCQAEWIMGGLRRNEPLARAFEFVYLASFGETPEHHPINSPEFIPSCDFVVWQTAPGTKPPPWLAGIRSDCRQIRFPTLWMKMLWPLHTADPRNHPEPGFPFGRYPYGDRLVLKLLEEGVAPADMPARYREADLGKLVNLDRFAEMSQAELQINDRQSDVGLAPYIEREFRARRLFGTVNHPTLAPLYFLSDFIAEALGGSKAVPSEPRADAHEVMGDEEIPVHPQVAAHFKLQWVTHGTKWRYHSALLTTDEFIQSYAGFEAIAKGETPQLWLAKGEYAASMGNLAEVERILLEATARFPGFPQFLQFLAVILVRHDRHTQAEKVLRYSVARFPGFPPVWNDLGTFMLRQARPNEAVTAFDEALRLDPGNAVAKRNVSLLRSRGAGGLVCKSA